MHQYSGSASIQKHVACTERVAGLGEKALIGLLLAATGVLKFHFGALLLTFTFTSGGRCDKPPSDEAILVWPNAHPQSNQRLQ